MLAKKLVSTILPPFRMAINRFYPYPKLVRFYPYIVPLRHSFCIQREKQRKINNTKVWDQLLDEKFSETDPKIMLDLYKKAIDQKKDIENRPDRDNILSTVHFNIGLMLLEQNDIKGALDILKSGKDILLKSNQKTDEGILVEIYYQMNSLYCLLEKWEAAINCAELALKIHKKLNLQDDQKKAATLANTSIAYLKLDDVEKSKEKIDEAIDIYKEIGGKYNPFLIKCYNVSMKNSFLKEDWNLFFTYVDAAIEIGTESEGPTRDEGLKQTLFELVDVIETLKKRGFAKGVAVATRLETILEKFFRDKTDPDFFSAYFELGFLYTVILDQPKKGLELLEKAEKIDPSRGKLDAFIYPRAKALMNLGRYQETRSYLRKLEELLDQQASEISKEDFEAKRKHLDGLYMKFYLRSGEYQKSLSYIEKIEPDSKIEAFLLGFRKTFHSYCLERQEEASEFLMDLLKNWESLSEYEKKFLEKDLIGEIRPLLDNEVSNKNMQKMLEDALVLIQKSETGASEMIPLFLQMVAQCYYNQRQYDKCAQTLDALIVHLESIKVQEPNRTFSMITFGSNAIDTRILDLWKGLLETKAKDINDRKKIKIASLWMKSSLKLLECHRSPMFLAKEGFERCETILVSENSPEAKILLGHTRLYMGLLYLVGDFLWGSRKYLDESINSLEACEDEQINLTLAYLLLGDCYRELFEQENSIFCHMKVNEMFEENNTKADPKDKEKWIWLSKICTVG